MNNLPELKRMNGRKKTKKNFLPYEYKVPSDKQSKIKLKNGNIIKFKYELDIDLENKGWVVNKLLMYINGLESGYMKISYIPKSHWEYYKGNVLKWMIQENKIYLKGITENSREYKIEVCKKRNNIFNFELNTEIYENLEKIDDTILDEEYKKSVIFFNKTFKKEYENDKSYFVDKPLVDYSIIYDTSEMIKYNYSELEEKWKYLYSNIAFDNKYRLSDLEKREIPEQYNIEFQGKGYAKYLYLQAAKWVGMNNQRLYAGLLNEKSEKVWESIKKKKIFNFTEEPHVFDKSKKRQSISSDKLLILENKVLTAKEENTSINKEMIEKFLEI
jgi:hypothetical protein